MSRTAGRAAGPADLTDRILDAAATLFARQGVAKPSMGDVAAAAGCSRATVYRYYEDRRALQVAFVHRETRRVAAAVALSIESIQDPAERVGEAVLRCVGAVRADPVLHSWFSGANLDITRDLIASSSVIEQVATAFLGVHDPLRAEWLVRTIVSLIVFPGADEAAERVMVSRFVAGGRPDRVTASASASGTPARRS